MYIIIVMLKGDKAQQALLIVPFPIPLLLNLCHVSYIFLYLLFLFHMFHFVRRIKSADSSLQSGFTVVSIRPENDSMGYVTLLILKKIT